jgi:phosphoglycerol transferase MdoB-like AlkP superfamily enzyme
MGSMAYYNVQDLGIRWNSKYEEWPSDVDLVEKATPKFIDNDKFMVFLTTVTPHQPYLSYSEYGDKHLSELKDYNYSKPVKRYMSKLKELDASLELLLQKLEAAGKLDDTVIALFCDHYPYGLTNNQINEVLDYNVKVDKEVDRTPMIIYNSATEPKIVEEYTSIIDLLPTLLNMFDLDYDPRLYLGTDVFSTTHGRTVFADGSWQDNLGYYNNTSGKFNAKDDNAIYTDAELLEINQEITLRQKMSALAIKNNYFNYLNKNLIKIEEEKAQKEAEAEEAAANETNSEERVEN